MRIFVRPSLAALFSLLWLALPLSSAQAQDTGVTEELALEPANMQSHETGEFQTPEDPNWLDTSHSYVTNRADQLARWLDDFFGVHDSDLDSAHSLLRLQIENEWEGSSESDVNVSLRGKLHLPQIDKRLSLVFADGIGEDENERSAQQILPSRNRDTDVALQYNLQEQDRSRFDLRLSLHSVTDLKVAARYRYTYPFRKNYVARFTETFYHDSDEGFGSITRLKIDRSLSENRQLGWYNYFKYGEITQGVEWTTETSLSRRLSEKRAIEYIAAISGETRPTGRTTRYALGVLYRQNIFRPWLFWELEPAYAWERNHLEPEWKSGPILTLRLEIRLQDDSAISSAKRAASQETLPADDSSAPISAAPPDMFY